MALYIATYNVHIKNRWETVTQYVKLYFGFGLQPVFQRPDIDEHWSAALVE